MEKHASEEDIIKAIVKANHEVIELSSINRCKNGDKKGIMFKCQLSWYDKKNR